MARVNQFTLEVTTTAICNLDCTYCFEGVKVDKTRLDDKLDILQQRIGEFLEHPWFKENYDILNISFWGGEPTMNFKLIVDIMQKFQHRDDVSFHIYTNGYDRRRLNEIVDNVDLSKLHIQISYDGKEINDIFRLKANGDTTSSQVMSNLEYFAKKGVSISLKATIPLKSMMNLYPVWQDYKKIHDALNSIGDNVTVRYAPTIDYVEEIPRDKLGEMIETFRTSMLRIAKEEISFYKEHGYFLCTWFDGGETKVHCSSGVNMHAIDVDGNSYACHGALYSPNKEQMKGSNIENNSFVDDIVAMSNKYREPISSVSTICTDCVATTCMICPVSSLDNSKEVEFFAKWTDRWVTNMCGFFKAFGEIDRTVLAHIDKEI